MPVYCSDQRHLGLQCVFATSLYSARARAGYTNKAQPCVPQISTMHWHPLQITSSSKSSIPVHKLQARVHWARVSAFVGPLWQTFLFQPRGHWATVPVLLWLYMVTTFPPTPCWSLSCTAVIWTPRSGETRKFSDQSDGSKTARWSQITRRSCPSH